LGGFLIQPYSYFVAVILSSLYNILLISILMIILLWLFQKSSLYPPECRINQLQFVCAFSLGIPVTPNTITGAIIVVGLSRRVSTVGWGLA
jgi:hypothetical protein